MAGNLVSCIESWGISAFAGMFWLRRDQNRLTGYEAYLHSKRGFTLSKSGYRGCPFSLLVALSVLR